MFHWVNDMGVSCVFVCSIKWKDEEVYNKAENNTIQIRQQYSPMGSENFSHAGAIGMSQ